MNYEKKYNEALEDMRAIYPNLKGDAKLAVEHAFPQLRESEDERIRRALVEYFGPQAQLDFIRGVPIQKIRDWLEKQKEQNHDGKKWIYEDDYHKDMERSFNDGKDEVLENPEKYGLQQEQKPAHAAKEMWKEMRLEVYAQASGNRHEPNYSDDSTKMFSLCDIDEIFEKIGDSTVGSQPAEWSEDYREEDIQTRFAFYTYKDDPSILYLSNVFVEEASRNHGFGTRILKAAEKVAEAIGAITICLKVKQDSPANAWYRKRGYGYVAFEDGYDWLEKNLEYLKPKKEVEWSEENSTILDWAVKVVEEAGLPSLAASLKFLRPRWKPSEEQMEALQCSIAFMEIRKASDYDISPLKSIYEQLKKLGVKEEPEYYQHFDPDC